MYAIFDKKARTGKVFKDLTQVAEWIERSPSTVQKWLFHQPSYESERYIIFGDKSDVKSRRGSKRSHQFSFTPK